MLRADLTPLPSEALVDPDVATPARDATRLTRVIGEESGATAIIAGGPGDPIEAALARAFAQRPADPERDRALIAAVAERLPGRAPREAAIGSPAVAAALVVAAVAATAVMAALIPWRSGPSTAVVGAALLLAVAARPRALRLARLVDAPAAALCVCALGLVLGIDGLCLNAGSRVAIAAAGFVLGAFAFAWSWSASAAAHRRLPLARLVGAAFVVLAHGALAV